LTLFGIYSTENKIRNTASGYLKRVCHDQIQHHSAHTLSLLAQPYKLISSSKQINA